MSIKALLYISNNGDGSSSVTWIRGSDQEKFEDAIEKDEEGYLFESYNDGDGITHRETLEFDSYESAQKAGVVFENVLD